MAFITIDSNTIKVGDPITKDLLDQVKDNFDDHETRISDIETSSGKIPIFSFLVTNNSPTPNLNGVCYYTSQQNMTVTDCVIQIFEKNSLTGNLEIDIKKSTTDLANASFNSIFTTKPKIDYSTASDYDVSSNQVFNAGQTLAPGDVLRLDIVQIPIQYSTSLPVDVIDKFLVICYGGT